MREVPKFTVFTPAYNRAHTLPRLYESLKNQSFFDFEWLIVDDGSTDGTGELVSSWLQKYNPFEIIYIKKENGGKPRAINYAVQKARGEYFIIMDSDDYLLPDAVGKFGKWCEEISFDDSFIGVGAARGYSQDEYIKGRAPRVNAQGFVDASNLERAKYDLDADMVEAYKTEIFKRFPMAEWRGEKFAPEQIALNEIALAGYKLRWHSDIVYICEYLEDGLTKGSFQLEKNNPMGYAMMYNHMLKYPDMTAKQKFRAACQHIALSLYGKNPSYIFKSNRMLYTIAALPFGAALAVRRRMQFGKR